MVRSRFTELQPLYEGIIQGQLVCNKEACVKSHYCYVWLWSSEQRVLTCTTTIAPLSFSPSPAIISDSQARVGRLCDSWEIHGLYAELTPPTPPAMFQQQPPARSNSNRHNNVMCYKERQNRYVTATHVPLVVSFAFTSCVLLFQLVITNKRVFVFSNFENYFRSHGLHYSWHVATAQMPAHFPPQSMQIKVIYF